MAITISSTESIQVLQQNLEIARGFHLGRSKHQFPASAELPARSASAKVAVLARAVHSFAR